MGKSTKTIIWGVVFILFLAGAAFLYNSLKNTAQNNMQTASQSEEKVKAPDFTVIDNSGKQTKLSDHFGKPIVLNFWASWCPPCKSEMPDFNEVYLDKGNNINFMMVNMTDGERETKEKGEKYVNDMNFKFPVYYDTQQSAALSYGVSSIPATVFIDKDGYIVANAQGAILQETLLKGINMISNKK